MYLHVEDYGFFRMEYPALRNDGTKETKDVTAYSIEKEVFNTDWVGLKINTAEQDSQEMLIEGNVTGYAMPINLISFYNPYDERLSLLNILISKTPLWSVGYVDPYIYRKTNDAGEFIQATKKSTTGQDIPQTFSSSGRWTYNDDCEFVYDDTPKQEPKYELKSVGIYEEDNISIYAFLTSTLGPKVGCLFFFDTQRRLIHAVSKYSLEHDDTKYDTGIFVGFRNLANTVDLSVEEDSVVTRVNCEGGEGLNFLDLNYGSTRLYDLLYFAHEPYMTEETAAKVLAWQELIESKRAEYKELAAEAIRINDEIADLTLRVPADENYWKNWDGLNEEALNKSLAYYRNEIALLQESVDNDPRYDSDGKYVPYNQGKTDEWYETRLAAEENGYGGYGTYFETVTYIIPNILVALNNLNLVSTDPNYQQPNRNVEYDWELYGIVELEAQIKNLTNQFDSIKNYYGSEWPDVETPEAAEIMGAHAWNKEFYLKQRQEYLKLYAEIGPDGSAYKFLDSLYLKRDGTDRTGTPVSDEAVANSMNGQLRAIQNQMLPYKQYYELDKYFTEEDLAQIYPLLIDTDYSNTNIQMQETDTAATKIDVEQELLDDCLDKVSELSQPQITFTSDLDNLYRIEKFDTLSKDLNLLKYIHLAVRQDYIVKLRVTGISWNPCDIDSSLTIEFSNMITSRSGRSDFTDIINSENNRGQKNGISIGANGQIGGSGESIDYLTNLMQALSGTGIFKKKVKNTVDNPVTGVLGMVDEQDFMFAMKTVPGMSRFVLDSAQVADLETDDTIMSGGKIKTGFINAKYIAVEKLMSATYTPDPQSVYSQAGMMIDLNAGTNHVGTITAPNFAIDEDGNAYFRGTIEASTLKGVTLIASTLKNAETNPTFEVTSGGKITSKNADGTSQTTIEGGLITTNNVDINGGDLNIGDGVFHVDSTGALTATSATITGTITSSNATITGGSLKVGSAFEVNTGGKLTSTSAAIGGWNIDSNSIYYGTKSTGTGNGDITLMSSSTFTRNILGGNKTGLKFAIGSRFGVAQDGTVYANYLNAKNVTISGSITATSGTIGKCSINANGDLKIPFANIEGTVTATNLNAATGTFKGTMSVTYGGNTVTIGNTGNSDYIIKIVNSEGHTTWLDGNYMKMVESDGSRSATVGAKAVYDGFGICVHSIEEGVRSLDVRGRTQGGNYLEVSGANGVYGVTMWSSDKSLKKDIKDSGITALSAIKSIRHRQFVWKEKNIKQQLGYIAQELETVIPHSTICINQPDGSNLRQIDETVILPYVTKAIQQLSAQVDDLKEENRKLRKELQQLNPRR